MILVEDCGSGSDAVAIYRRRTTGAVLYDQLGSSQSEADCNGVSLASYIHALFGLVLQARARDVLMIGCGGGTLATMLARAGSNVTIVDINPDAFTLARRYFSLPHDVACHPADGAAYLALETHRFDTIVLDAYQGDVIPDHLRTPDFFRLAERRLSERGAFFVNVHLASDDDQMADTVARSMAEAWSGVRLLDAPGWLNRNAIAMAGDVSRLTPPVLHMWPSESSEQIAFELGTLQFRAE